ncbi:MAG: MBL fold metallo-hydrolase [Pedobacter sp.]|uniref:MBL fold metallo-hydrolase n=1 Tax=Pedobacter sp. TaxID=1411316 RepID=UPI003569094D
MEMSNVQVKIIGCGDAFGSGGRLNTCFYVNAGPVRFLVDCGATSLPGLKQHGINADDIDAIVISHFHGDHYGGVPFVLLDAAIHSRTKKMQVISPVGGQRRIAALLDLLYPGTEVLEKLDVEFLEYGANEVLNLEGWSLQAFDVLHSERALPHGLRIEVADKVIAYSGDTSWTDALFPLSADADLFICECNFFDLQVKGHLNYLELEKRLPEFSCKRMVLTHFDPQMLDMLDEVHVECLSDGIELFV